MASSNSSVSDDLRMVLLGNAGVGKSAAANVILGGETFRETETTECEIQTGRVDVRNVSVIDTPGINTTALSSEQLKTEIRRCLSLSAPGPHVFLLVIRVGRFTEDVRNTVKWIQENFGEEALKFTMVLFTGREKMTSLQWKRFSVETNVQDFTNQFGGGYAVINSKREIYPSQKNKLLEKIDEMVKQNRGQHYTSEMCEMIHKRKSEEAERPDEEQKRADRDRQKHEQERELQEEKRKGRQEDGTSQQDRRGQRQEGEMQKVEWKRKEEGQEGRDNGMTQDNMNKTVGEIGCILDEQSLRATMFKTIDGSVSKKREEGTVEDEVKGKLVRKEESCRFPTKAIRGNERFRQDLESRRERERSKWEHELSEVEEVPNTVSDVRIVLVGEPGSGKSATGNTILGREAFGKDIINAPRTAIVCRRQDGMVGNKSVTVIDTKGFSSSRIYYSIPTVLAPSEFKQCLQLCFPGPHVFLLVIRDLSGAYAAFNIKYHFGEEFLKRCMVLITHGDKHGKIEKMDFSFGLERLVDSCGGQYHIFNNEVQEDRTQVTQLLEKIETLVQKNGGTHYSNEMYQEVQRKRIEEESCSVL